MVESQFLPNSESATLHTWPAQAEPIVIDSSGQLIIPILVILAAFILIVLFLLRSARRRRNASEETEDIHSRLEDYTHGAYEAPPLPPEENSFPMDAPAPVAKMDAEPETLSPIEQKLLEAERAEAEAHQPATEDMTPEVTVPVTAGIIGDLEIEDNSDVDALWDELNIEFEQGNDLAFLLGEDLPEDALEPEVKAEPLLESEPFPELPFPEEPFPEPEPTLPLTILADIEARTFLEQVNHYKLQNQGFIMESETECRLSWNSAQGEHEICIKVEGAETLNINGETYPATPDAVKQGIVASLKKI